MTVIPAVNAKTIDEAKDQLRKIAAVFSGDAESTEERWIHLDVADGSFTPNVTWGNPEAFRQLVASGQSLVANFEIHLMVEHPELVLPAWLAAGAKRIIVHAEAVDDAEVVTDACRAAGARAMLAANPETPVERLLEARNEFDEFQVLAVPPGRAGQAFDTRVVEKIRALRAAAPRARIEVDGGITPETAELVKEAGADILVSASYVLNAKDPLAAYQELEQV